MAESATAAAPAEGSAGAPWRGRNRITLAKWAVGLAFWGWVLLRWLNDWLGGVLVPPGEPFLQAAVFTGLEAGVPDAIPVVNDALVGLAFAVEFLPRLVNAMWLTVILTVVSIAIGFVIAVPLAAARVYGRVWAVVSLAYVELLRGTPLLAQLFVLYYGLPWLPTFFRELPWVGAGFLPGQAVFVAVVGFTLNSAAYQAEYIRGAIESVDTRQLQAARAVGLDQVEGIRFVVLPQALRYAIPGWTNELVYLIKYSSLAAFITVPELFQAAGRIASQNYRYTALFVIAGILYLGLVITATNVMERVGETVSIPGVGTAAER